MQSDSSLFSDAPDDRQRPASAERQVPWSVTELTRALRGAIRVRFPAPVTVVGEISDFKAHSSGHWYFTLQDAASELGCVMWRSENIKLRFQPEEGLQLVARGELDVYERGGRYQLYVRNLQPQGTGDLELAFRQLYGRLQDEGLFDRARKKPIPRIPAHIALVTSPTGAALHDVLQVIRRRFPCVQVTVCPVLVQGETAAPDMVAALDRLNRRSDIDSIILARGGGALQDLWAFNEEILARAIFRSRIPIITGIGHEVDVTIADLVADLRAATPSAAAEQAVPERAELSERLAALQALLLRLVHGRCRLAVQTLQSLARREPLRAPAHFIRGHRQHIDHLSARLGQVLSPQGTFRMAGQRLAAGEQAMHRSLRAALQYRSAALDSLNKQLRGVSHQRTLQRGYTVTTDALTGQIIAQAAQVIPGQTVRTRTFEGTFESQVCDTFTLKESGL